MKWFDNAWLWGSVAFGIITLIPILYVEPIARYVFVHKMITWEWGVIGIALFVFMALCELYKVVKNVVDPPQYITVPEDESDVDRSFSAQVTARDNRTVEEVAHDNVVASFAAISMRTATDD